MKGKAGLPGKTLAQPLPEQVHLVLGQALALGRHAQVLILGGDDLQQLAAGRLLQVDNGSVLPAAQQFLAVVQGKAALQLVATVAFGAVLAQQGHDLVIEIHGRLQRRTGKQQARETYGWVHSH